MRLFLAIRSRVSRVRNLERCSCRVRGLLSSRGRGVGRVRLATEKRPQPQHDHSADHDDGHPPRRAKERRTGLAEDWILNGVGTAVEGPRLRYVSLGHQAAEQASPCRRRAGRRPPEGFAHQSALGRQDGHEVALGIHDRASVPLMVEPQNVSELVRCHKGSRRRERASLAEHHLRASAVAVPDRGVLSAEPPGKALEDCEPIASKVARWWTDDDPGEMTRLPAPPRRPRCGERPTSGAALMPSEVTDDGTVAGGPDRAGGRTGWKRPTDQGTDGGGGQSPPDRGGPAGPRKSERPGGAVGPPEGRCQATEEKNEACDAIRRSGKNPENSGETEQRPEPAQAARSSVLRRRDSS
jgi:hypothetical protein